MKCNLCKGTKQLGPPITQSYLPCWKCDNKGFIRFQITTTLGKFQGQNISDQEDIKNIADAIMKAIDI